MRIRRSFVTIVVLVVVSAIATALLRGRDAEEPKVRLTRLQRVVKSRLPDQVNIFTELPWTGTDGMAEEVLEAGFQIYVRPGSGTAITYREIGVEMLGADGHWRALEPPPWRRLGLEIPFPRLARLQSRGESISFPVSARSCRLLIPFRGPTIQERFLTIANFGLGRRFPKATMWIAERMPTTERWQVCRREVPLAVPPMGTTDELESGLSHHGFSP